MEVIFGKIEIHNFMSILDLEFDFASPSFRGINLILGENMNTYTGDDDGAANTVGCDASNGAGKSTLFAALCFALYGDSIKHTEAALIPNRSADPKEPVSLVLNMTSDGRRFRIERTLTGKSRKTTLTLVETLDDGTEKDLTLSTVKLTQAFISNKVVGCGMSMFLRSVLLRNDPSNNFFDLDKAAKVKFIEELFDLGVFTEMYSQIHRDKLDADRALYGLGQVKLTLDRALADARGRFESWTDTFDVERAENERLLAEAEQKLASAESAAKAALEVATQKKQAFDAIEARFPAQRKKVESLFNRMAEAKSGIAVCLNDERNAEQMMTTHRKTRDILCDDCRGKFDGLVHFGELESKRSVAFANRKNLEAERESVEKEYRAENEKLSKGNDILARKRRELLDAQSAEQRTRIELDRVKGDIDKYRKLLAAPRVKRENPYADMVRKAEADVDGNASKMSEAEAKARRLAALETVVSPDTIRNIVISGLVSELNSRIKYYLQRMGATYTCVFDKSLDYRFVTDTGETGYGNFSKGEEMRLSVATTFAFRDFMLVRINTRTNLLLVDEYLDSSLDRLAKRGIMAMFSEFVAENRNMGVFLITHDEYVKAMDFSSVLKFTKTGDVSTLDIDLH